MAEISLGLSHNNRKGAKKQIESEFIEKISVGRGFHCKPDDADIEDDLNKKGG